VLDDGDVVEPLPAGVQQPEAVLDGEDQAAAVAQPGRPDRLAHAEDRVAADGPALRVVVVDMEVIARLQDRKLCASAMRDHAGMEVRRGDGSVIAVEVAGEHDAAPVLFCHGLADSRLSACWFARAAAELGLRVIAPARPGTGGTDPRRLSRLADWVADAALVLDALRAGSAALLGISAGGPFAAACAAAIPGRVTSLTLVSPLGPPGWPTRGMAPGERLSLALARRAPAFSGWSWGRLGTLARAAGLGSSSALPPARWPSARRNPR
jgi:pimeloyl-ACP methyl ester carboxylesterase